PPTSPPRLSLHDALPIYRGEVYPSPAGEPGECGGAHRWREHEADHELVRGEGRAPGPQEELGERNRPLTARPEDDHGGAVDEKRDRKSTRLNSSHVKISY